MYFAQPSKPCLIQSARSSFDKWPRRENALLEFPRVGVASLQHVSAVVRLDHDRGATAQTFGDECRDVSEVHHGGDLHAVMRRGETEVVDGVVRDRERVKVDLADAKVLTRLDLFDAIAQRVGTGRGSSLVTLKRSLT